MFYPARSDPSGWELEDWLVIKACGHIMLRPANHLALDGGLGLRCLRRLVDDSSCDDTNGAVISIALGAWL